MRGIFYYPLDIDVNCGTRLSLIAYAKALKSKRIELDLCFYKPAGHINTFDRFQEPYFERIFPSMELNLPDRYFWDKTNVETSHGTGIVVPMHHLYSAANIIAAGQYDFVGVHYTACHQLADMLPPELPKILFTHDLDSIVQQQKGNIVTRNRDYSLKDEIQRMEKFDFVTAIGPEDLKLLIDAGLSKPVIEATCCPLAETRITIRDEMKNLLFMGSNAPFKQLSLEWFSSYCWPHLLDLGFGGCLNIVGGISEYAKTLDIAKHPQCIIHGYVSSVENHLLDTDLLLSPYYYGGGIKTNILEAAGMGIPVATTHYGLTNTRFSPGKDILIANDGVNFAKVIMSAAPKKRRMEISESAMKVIEDHHSQPSLLPMVNSIRTLVENKRTSFAASCSTRNQDPILQDLTYRIPYIINEMNQKGFRKIGIYGAGGHTDRVLFIWKKHEAPAITRIFVSGTPKTESLECISISNISDIHLHPVDAILLSSKLYEIDLAINAYKLAPEIPIYLIWNPGMNIPELSMEKEINEREVEIQSDIPF